MMKSQKDNTSNKYDKQDKAITAVIFFDKKEGQTDALKEIDNANTFFMHNQTDVIPICKDDIRKGFKVICYKPPLIFNKAEKEVKKDGKEKKKNNIVKKFKHNPRYIFYKNSNNITSSQTLDWKLSNDNNDINENINNIVKQTIYDLFRMSQFFYTQEYLKRLTKLKTTSKYSNNPEAQTLIIIFNKYEQLFSQMVKLKTELEDNIHYNGETYIDDESLNNFIKQNLNPLIKQYNDTMQTSEELYKRYEYSICDENIKFFKELYKTISREARKINIKTLEQKSKSLLKLMSQRTEISQQHEDRKKLIEKINLPKHIKTQIFIENLKKDLKFQTYIGNGKEKCYIHFDQAVYNGPITPIKEIQTKPLKYIEYLTPKYNLNNKDIEISRSND